MSTIQKRRNKYFEIFIEFNFSDSPFKLTSDKTNLKKILQTNQFPDQNQVQQLFSYFELPDRGRLVKLKKVSGKLLLKSATNFPYWKILCETTILVTGRKIQKVLSEKLFSEKKPINIKVSPFDTSNSFEQNIRNLHQESCLILESSPYFPI